MGKGRRGLSLPTAGFQNVTVFQEFNKAKNNNKKKVPVAERAGQSRGY